MEYAKVKIPFENSRVFPGGQRGFYENSKKQTSLLSRQVRQVFSEEFRIWLDNTCGPATLGLYRKEKYYTKRGREVSQNVADVSALKPALGYEFEFASKRHALLFKLTWGGL